MDTMRVGDMKRVLERLHKDPVFQNDLGNDVLQRIVEQFDPEDANIPAETLWSRLSVEEQMEFINCVDSLEDKDGSIVRDLVELWEPWWHEEGITRRGSTRSLSSTSTRSSRIHATEKSPVPDIINFSRLSSIAGARPAHESTIFNLVDILLSYTFVLRRLNGELFEDCIESANMLWILSATLSGTLESKPHTVHEGITPCLISIRKRAREASKTTDSIPTMDDAFSVVLIKDVVTLFSKWDWIQAALSDLAMLFAAVTEVQDLNDSNNKLKGLAGGTEKKLVWFLGWSEDVKLEEGSSDVLRLVTNGLMIESNNLVSAEPFQIKMPSP
jgi:hypothetical protein